MVLSIAFLLLAPVTIRTDFEAGSLGAVERVSDAHFRCALKGEADQDKRNRQISWYYFRLDNAAGREVTIDLTDLVGEYNYKPGARAIKKNTPGVYSYDNQIWTHFDASQWDEGPSSTIRLRFRPAKNRVWIAHVPPYTTAHLARLLAEFREHPHLKREVIGKTLGHRDMLLLTVTNPAVPDAGKKVLWLMFRQHSWESGSSWVGEGALRYLLSSDPDATRIRDECVVKIFPMADPDGVARGGVRFNSNGYDLNRNWDAADPKTMPEIAAQRNAVLKWVDSGRRLDLFYSLHNTETGEYISRAERFRALGDRVFELLVEKTSFDPPQKPRDEGASTTPGKPGRMNVCQGLFQDRGIPCILMEQRIAYNNKLGHFPNIDDRLKFGRELVQALCKAIR